MSRNLDIACKPNVLVYKQHVSNIKAVFPVRKRLRRQPPCFHTLWPKKCVPCNSQPEWSQISFGHGLEFHASLYQRKAVSISTGSSQTTKHKAKSSCFRKWRLLLQGLRHILNASESFDLAGQYARWTVDADLCACATITAGSVRVQQSLRTITHV